jgi:phosphopantetheinyl transferase
MSDVIVLHAMLPRDGGAGRIEWWLKCLPYGYRLELERRDAAQRLASVCGIELALAGAACLGPAMDASRLRFPQGGKPAFDNGPSFSVSHTMTRVAVALSTIGDIGLDVEEAGDAAEDEELCTRLRQWTATEATLKALGVGVARAGDVRLAPRLDRATLDGRTLFLRAVDLGAGAVAHVAGTRSLARVHVEERPL